MSDIENRWAKIASDQLLGRTIKSVRYMTDEEATELDWYSRPVVMVLDNGHLIWPSSDDEGNDGGSFFTTNEANPVLPVISRGD